MNRCIQGPKRVSASRRIKNIPIDVYEEIFSWLRPCVDLDMDLNSQQKIFARLASVCRYFAYYAICEMCCYLDFDGKERCPRPPTPTGPWCTGIIKRVQPMETLRAKVKECNIHNWIPTGIPHQSEVYQVASTFLKRFPLVLLRLDNLRILTLSETPISYFLLQAVGRLRSLEQLVIHKCCVYDQGPKEAIFGTHETPFPALHQLTIADVKLEMEAVYKDAFCVLGSVATLRSLVISSCLWLRFLLPHISPHLVSLEGNFSAIPLDTFLQFVNAHAALKDLAIHFQPLQRYPSPQFGPAKKQSPYIFSYATLDLGQDVLPNLRSFNGPLSLAPKFIRSRPVTRLAIGSHLPTSLPFPVLNTRVPLAFSQGFHGSAFLHRDTYVAIHNWHDYRLTRDGSDDIWDDLKTIGGDIQELFVRFDDTKLPVTTLSSCFPNLVRLQLELCWDDKSVSIFMEPCSSLLKTGFTGGPQCTRGDFIESCKRPENF